MRRIDPLYLASAALLVVTLVVLAATTTGPASTSARSASAYDSGTGGAMALRRYLEAMGATTVTVQGESFAVPQAAVLLILGASEAVSDTDIQQLRAFVRSGGTVVAATEQGLFDRGIFDAFGVRIAGIAIAGAHDVANAAFADPPARRIFIDRGVTFAASGPGDVLATDGRSPVIVAARDGSGTFIAVGSLWPFLGGGLGEEDNGRVVLALLRPAIGRTLAIDEYHHGLHPTSDLTVLIERTWPGRSLVFVGVLTFLYLVLSGRRLGRPVPIAVRPARSSLEYVRGFAGLVRRSGRGEIARRRMRDDLHAGLARDLGLDPATPFERVLVTLAAQDRGRAARARALDDALAGPLPDDRLLRTVASIDTLLAEPHP